jgi:phage shock protein E
VRSYSGEILMNRWHRLRRGLATAAVATALLAGATACSSGGGVEHLPAAEFAQSVTKANTVVVDVRTAQEFAAGHLPGAINIDIDGGSFDSQIAGLDKSKHYTLYCHSGRRSGIAAQKMADAGFKDVVDLKGGIQTWTGAVVTG